MRRLGQLLVATLALLALAATATAAAKVVFGGDVAGLYRQRPTSIHLTSDQNLKHIKWSSWGGAVAHGSGTLVFSKSDMTPAEKVTLSASRVKQCPKRRQYLRLRITAVKKPAHGPRSSTVDYTCKSPF